MVPIPGSSVVVEGLELTAETATGRRNRVGTLLVRRADELPAERPAEEERVDA
jgi:hypothetical protein